MEYNKNQARLNALYQLLSTTDYQAIKYSEGMISPEAYEPIKAKRQAWRDEINVLEAEIIQEESE